MDAAAEGSRHFLSAMAWTQIFTSLKQFALYRTREGTLHVFHEDTPDKFSVIENRQD